MPRPSGWKTALGAVLGVVLWGATSVSPAWADCGDGAPDEFASGDLTNQLTGGPYEPGCASAIAFDSNFTMFTGTCAADGLGSPDYSIDVTGAVGPNLLVIITWAAGPNGTPNSSGTFLHTDYDTPGGDNTCVHDYEANSGPLAVTLKGVSVIVPPGSALPMALAALTVVAAGLVYGGRRVRRRAQDAQPA